MRRSVWGLWWVWLLVGGSAFAQDTEQRYVIDAGESDIQWLVYKAGALARLGHNHVIAVNDLSGSVNVNPNDRGESRFEMEFSVGALVIDDPQRRSGLGPDFASVPTADQIVGTRGNMLGEHVLDGDKFPKIRIVGAGPSGGEGSEILAITVELLGRTVDLKVPTKIVVDAALVEASGEFELNHADLGMQPFSVMMGALQVGEKLSFSYRVKARRSAP